MKVEDVKKICVMGAGLMGNGIAQTCAQAGYKVAIRDIEDRFVEGGLNNIKKNLSRAVSKEKMTQEQMDAILGNIYGTTDLKEAVKQRIQNELSYGDTVFVDSPEYLGIELSFYITTVRGAENIDSIRDEVKDVIIQYINDLPIGGEIIWNRIVNIALEVEGVEDFIPNIFKFGEYDSFNKIKVFS